MKTPRIKTRFKSSEIAHVWANSAAPHGHNGSNLRFDGDTFYSYATVIARRIRHGAKVAYIVDLASFSVTTSGHQSDVRRAIPDTAKTFYIHQGCRNQSLDFTPAQLRDLYLAEFRDTSETPSRYAHKRAEALLHRVNRLESAIDVCQFFGLAHKALDKTLASMAGEVTEARVISEAKRAKLAATREVRDAKRRARWEMAEAAEKIKYITLAETALAGGEWPKGSYPFGYEDCKLESRPDLQAAIGAARIEREKNRVALWQAGDTSIDVPYGLPVMLRASGGDLETSLGARVPLDQARRTYDFARKVRTLGWHRNGQTHKVGMYELDAVNDAGLVAGCHRIKWEEVERFAAVQGWTAEVATI